MKKLFTLAVAVLASVCLMAETVTMDCALAKGSTPSPSIGVALLSGGAFDGNGYKMSNDGNYIGWNISAANKTFTAVTFSGYINSNDASKLWGFQFSTDGGTTWGTELTQNNEANNKAYHDITVGVTIPSGANAIRIIRRAGTSAYVRSITLTLADDTPASDPVTSITVNGPEAGYIGLPVTLTAKTDVKADTIWWTDQYGTKQESKNGVFTFTPSAAGSYTYTAWAENAHNENPVTKEHSVTVTKLCGELIKVSATAYNAATATGIFSGTTSASMSSKDSEKSVYEDLTGYKLNTKNQHLGITFNAGQTLRAGDVATVFVTTVSAKLQLFADKGTTLIGETDNVVQGENQIILGSAANGANGIYVYRTEAAGADMNPFVAYISVIRSCEESDNTNIAELTVNGEAVTPSGSAYSYTLSSSYEEPTVSVAVTTEHPLAKITDNIGGDLANPFTIATPATGESNVMPFRVVAENGDFYNYVITITKSASLNNDATLSALSVEGYTLSPAFDAEVTAYTITKAYGAENPATSAVTATPNDANANAAVVLEGNVYTITVTAEDGETKKEYTITVNEAAARKALLRATFAFFSGKDSICVDGFIANGNIDVPYIGETQPTFVAVEFWQKDGEPTAEVVDGKLVVTGVDSQQDEYTITYHKLTPKTLDYEEVVFDTVPSYVFSVYGFDADKGVKFSKDVEEASNRRISEGKDRIYIALPAAGQVILTGGSAGARPIKITVNGNVSAINSTPKAGETIKLSLNKSKANFIGIESNKNNGDGGFIKLQLQQDYPTALDNTEDNAKAVKTIENGQIVIIKNGVRYNVLGVELR